MTTRVRGVVRACVRASHSQVNMNTFKDLDTRISGARNIAVRVSTYLCAHMIGLCVARD
jgi:hypothetical protein